MGNEKDERNNVENSLLNNISDIDRYDFGNEEWLFWKDVANSEKNEVGEVLTSDSDNEEQMVWNINEKQSDDCEKVVYGEESSGSWLSSLSGDAVTRSESYEQSDSEPPDVEKCI